MYSRQPPAHICQRLSRHKPYKTAALSVEEENESLENVRGFRDCFPISVSVILSSQSNPRAEVTHSRRVEQPSLP
jgi:hypothetical protein